MSFTKMVLPEILQGTSSHIKELILPAFLRPLIAISQSILLSCHLIMVYVGIPVLQQKRQQRSHVTASDEK